jgi:hypothetical protein
MADRGPSLDRWVAAAITALLVVTACSLKSGVAEPVAWKGSDKERKRFEKDKYDCMQEAPHRDDWDYFSACMQARGWKRSDASKKDRGGR